MKNLVVFGVVSPRGLGDALQYCITLKLLQKFFPEAEVTFLCRDLKDGFSVFKNLNLNAQLIDLGSAGGVSKALQTRKDKTIFLRIIRVITKNKYFNSYMLPLYYKYADSLSMKSFSFGASIFGGHTICTEINPYISKYDALRSATKGPMITSPISISKLSLQYYEKENAIFARSIMLKRLRNSLENFDFIYTRGPHSLGILRDYLGIDERKIAMALDSGFGAKLINSSIKSLGILKKKMNILIIPRKSYFYKYGRSDLYKLYLNSLTQLILWLFNNFEIEIYLTSQTIDFKYEVLGGQVAVNDLLNVFKNKYWKYFKHLTYVKPKNISRAYKLFNSMDLVITSYMHGGIMALSLGVPAFFILPSADTKVLDILSFLGLDVNFFLMDAFDVSLLNSENFINKIGKVVESLKFYRKSLKHTINRALPSIELPAKKLIELSE